ncbi:GntR domain protein [Gluconacetobacter diazotrophicus PA1 5]|uniref:FadR family transcriptional regulator n=2 Tax=Gluconacetobacter diazotrophicus TaxID=33996 RepID=A0A7W4I7V0_GLUDI|nr:FadR/GntR family transcriptional regulator [Gluconacetobacter diazotrophicus]ACI50671.1 GntR domain protein [Gluconacetobacter diazotrophicus PA1 5]MBB2157834.1 FadR family transcriptional regulator [Gluconacetobacter diazotrophicus]TWB09503.1 DNA-binding FadR family transcriptional regulator [Gluconacetobacter diazotrophicus]
MAESGANRRLYQPIAQAILKLIEAGDVPPGRMLPPERELSVRFGVSRSTVREAIIALEVMGIVEVRVGAGVMVLAPATARSSLARTRLLEPDPELPVPIDLETEVPPFDLLQARLLIEPETAALAAQNAGPRERAMIEAAFRQNIADNARGSRTHPGDRLFHIRIAQASGNSAYELTIMLLLGHRYGDLFRRLQQLYTPQDMPGRSEHEHAAILEAILAADPPRAREAMRRHIQAVIGIFSRDT